MDLHRPGLRLAIFYGAMFWLIGVRLPFWPVFLAGRGFTPVEIGILAGMNGLALLVMVPVIARLVDRTGRRRGPLILLSLATLAGHCLFLPAWSFWPMLVVTFVVAGLATALMPMTDNLAVLLARQAHIAYGPVRLWGSLSFIAASLAAGLWIAGPAEAEPALWLMIGGAAATALVAWQLPDPRVPPGAPGWGGLARLLSWPPFLAFLAAVALNHMSHGVLYGFASLHWHAAGLAPETISLLWAEGVVAEILLFAAGEPLTRRLGPTGLLALGVAGGVLRWLLLGATTWLPALILAQALHALTFGAVHLATMAVLARAIPPEISASAQSLNSALTFGLAMTLTLALSGPLFQALGGQAFWVMALFSLASLAATGLFARLWDGGAMPQQLKGEF